MTASTHVLQVFCEESLSLLCDWEEFAQFPDKHRKDLLHIAHNIKGTAQSLDLKALAKFMHQIEDTLPQASTTFLRNAAESARTYLTALLSGTSPSLPSLTQPNQTLRCEASKVDQIIHLASSLNQAMKDGTPADQLAAKLEHCAFRLQLTPARELLKNLARAGFDTARRTGKKVRISTAGSEVEIANSAIPILLGPLIHGVRNAIHHGIESERHPKPSEGHLRLSAQSVLGGVTITISDDGSGLDTQLILKKAIERGIDTAGLREQDLHQLVFRPGFSTAQEVCAVSGRGIGLDALKAAAEKLGGEVAISSQANIGTTLSVHIPLALNSVEVFTARSGQLRCGIPVTDVVEVRQTKNCSGESLAPLAHACGQQAELGPYTVFADAHGFCVDELNAPKTIMLTPPVGNLRGQKEISGMMLFTDGSPGVVLNLGFLARRQWGLKNA